MNNTFTKKKLDNPISRTLDWSLLQSEMKNKLGMEVLPVELRDAYAFGGGLHCCTADGYREGDLKDYFPKQ